LSKALENRIEALCDDLGIAAEQVSDWSTIANTGEYFDLYQIALEAPEEAKKLRKYADRLDKLGKDADKEGISLEIAEEESNQS
jgi:hypothetical protein